MPFSCQFQCGEGNTKEIFSEPVCAADLAVARSLTARPLHNCIKPVITFLISLFQFQQHFTYVYTRNDKRMTFAITSIDYDIRKDKKMVVKKSARD
jgi:hypothetical protein